MKKKIALFGGTPIFGKSLPITNTIGREEKNAVARVMDTGVLSDFVGRAGTYFLGGKEVKKLEQAFQKKFKIKHAVSFNSATTALEAALAALELDPGSEVIVSPYTMSATVTAIIVNNLVPIFADIDRLTFCLDPKSIASRVTSRTRAIFVTNLFGGSAQYNEIKLLAKKHGLKLIEDNAQSPGGIYQKKLLATIGDIGVFSFNFHKVIHSGEGGVLVTNNADYAFRAQLKRNHGENILDDLNRSDIFSVGSNYRMSELHAAIACEQLQKLDKLNTHRIKLAKYLTKKLSTIKGIQVCPVLPNTKHVFYVYPFLFDATTFGISREQFVRALAAEGFAVGAGYQKPIYLFTLFQSPSNYKFLPYLKQKNYAPGICPVAEQCYSSDLVLTSLCRYPLTFRHIDLFCSAIKKIQTHRSEFEGERI